jgi:predicted nucleotidyltransferase
MLSETLSAGWQFTEVSGDVGASFTHGYTVSISDEELSVSAGVAAGDYDNDGDVDLYLVTGNISENVLLENNGRGAFSNETAGSGVGLAGHRSAGPAFADIDGDGRLDLVVGSIKGDDYYVFKNNGDGTFTDFTSESGIADDTPLQNNYSTAFGDPDRDGDLDLFIAHPSFRESDPRNHYWRNDGTGVFSPIDGWSNITAWQNDDTTFAPIFTDINGDGWQDLLVAADIGNTEYFINDQTGKQVRSTTSAINDQFGMGAASGDFDNDGDIDWFVTSIYDHPDHEHPMFPDRTGNRLYINNNGSGSFSETSSTAGVRDGQWGWGARAADFNNDGWLDLYHVNGFPDILGEPDLYADDPARLFLNQQDDSFDEVAASLGVDDRGMGRGVVCFDYDLDGDIDLFIANNDGSSRLYRNDLDPNPGYLQVRLLPYPRRKTIAGSVIEIDIGATTQIREVTIGSNFESQNPLLQHFGLGGAPSIDELRVRWPSGEVTTLTGVTPNQVLVIDQDPALFRHGFEP